MNLLKVLCSAPAKWLRSADLDLGDPLLEIQGQRDQGQPLLTRLDPQLVDLAAVDVGELYEKPVK